MSEALWPSIEPRLLADERILWAGQPLRDKQLAPADRFLLPFSVLWLAFAIFWEAAAIAGGGGAFFVLWGVPFILVGLYIAFGRFFYKSYRKRHTVYAVTDQRVLSLYRGRSGESLSAAFISTIPAVNHTRRSDGSGTVIFGNAPPQYGMYANSGLDFFLQLSAGAAPVAFFDVADVTAVVDLVESARSRAA